MKMVNIYLNLIKMINLNNINRDDLASLRPDIQKQWIKENYIM